MNAYLFTAGVTLSEARDQYAKQGQTIGRAGTWDSCMSQIVGASNPEEAQSRFEAWLKGPATANPAIEVQIKKVVGAQIAGQLLAEEGGVEIDWPRVCQEANAILEGTPADDFEQGYWVDVNNIMRTIRASADLEALQRGLPEDVRSGLNWAPEKTFLFLVSVLSPPAPEPEPGEELDSETATAGSGGEEAREIPLDPSVAALPDLLEKEAAVLVKGRNSAVAAWLWQKSAAGTPLAARRIHISSWCGAIGFDEATG
ncbi:MAG: hypothetical protein ABSG59_02390 [Verrucomicrobiota bacterium]|jgi:hypothetical protein